MSLLPFLPNSIKAALRQRLLKRLSAIDAGPWTFAGDGLATVHNTDFLRAPEFERAYQLGSATGSWNANQPRFRVYTACWAALQARDVPGDYVECGVNRGGMARAQMELLDFQKSTKNYWLVDTFRGFPEEQKDLVSAAMPVGTYGECYADVVKTFAPFPKARIVRGIVPEVLSQVEAERVCYLSLDMNCAEPEIAALHFFWPRLSKGALILMDDYAYDGYERQKLALDEFAGEHGVSILGLATGQGLIIKN
ncbi:Macrocin-O-methyltransferase (TylF) [Abditibacterium utsteinense]|uniref:Macrocin-O-methyltransferase (TylF) n=1 Tax=Abditibacterium utsteinense TaxID=1960156 RepID=A0A2S8SQ11_9BACT|nr:TylF/MycF/NovP-related O-methyltransferase [Abditibacterium utsteinense]PQV62866.1 Macrocin-O-methyltransferase (TylF) [Abditibacterium utsteinense]